MKITHACLQPLSGAILLAANEVTGRKAEWVLSYPGLDSIYTGKDDKITGMGNERHLMEYLKSKKQLPNYVQFQHGMLDYPQITTIKNSSEYSNQKFDPSDVVLKKVDLITALPICSGLSAANCQDHGKEDSIKNNNLRYITRYVLQTIKPKVFIFENAPGLYTSKGKIVREQINQLAEENFYSVTYIKTDTKLHNNVQHRPRTFVIFWRWIDDKPTPPPAIGYENKSFKGVIEYLKLIPASATQNDNKHLCNPFLKDNPEFNFIKQKYGKNWRKEVGSIRLKSYIIHNKLTDEFYAFHKDDKLKAHYDRCLAKKAIGKGYYDRSFFVCPTEYTNTVYHGNCGCQIHPVEDRTFTMREYAHLMGMPHDWEYLHEFWSFNSQIGQNIPLLTGKFWIQQCVDILKDWDNLRTKCPTSLNKSNVYMHNNCNPKLSHYDETAKKKQIGKYRGPNIAIQGMPGYD